ncbi:hypothetical protein [Lignipirellula cremea]|uniref:Uncharacterized protein n=1 Tax=Lignipirellula cremea TaxID=2528010 RepID=A0A518E465_9BACT|nr:hypothetical protein [Lignipirellula cremea]QDU98853.1 hypothetical protein Pla8534_67640 [Lignipirellula cremea]
MPDSSIEFPHTKIAAKATHPATTHVRGPTSNSCIGYSKEFDQESLPDSSRMSKKGPPAPDDDSKMEPYWRRLHESKFIITSFAINLQMQSAPIDRFLGNNHIVCFGTGRAPEKFNSISSKACAMRFPRQLAAAAVLAFYVAQTVGGQAVHLRLCTAGSCCSSSHSHTHNACGHCHTHGACGRRHGMIADDRQTAGKSNQESPREGRRHDSSNCRVCQVLGQAHESPPTFTIEASVALCPSVEIVVRQAWLAPGVTGFRPRAPPEV